MITKEDVQKAFDLVLERVDREIKGLSIFIRQKHGPVLAYGRITYDDTPDDTVDLNITVKIRD